MDKEYHEINKKQKSLFKKYGKHVRGVMAGILIAIAGVTIIPLGLVPIFQYLLKFLSEYTITSIVIWMEALLFAGGIITTIVNEVKAYKTRLKIRDLQNEEENIVDSMINENDDLKRKVEELEKIKDKILEEKSEAKAIGAKEKDYSVDDYEDVDVKRKKYVK